MTADRYWPAPAKLNLFLHVIGRRDDGYHRLQTLFQILDHGDRLAISSRADGTIHCHHRLDGLDPEQDLVMRAARLLQRHAGCRLGADLTLVKHLPQGAGLGGGSSDAATVLVALNRIWHTGLAPDELAGLGLQLGADVPVFVLGHTAWGEDVGQRLVPADVPARWFAVVHPGSHVSTAEVFGSPELTRNTPAIKIPAPFFGVKADSVAWQEFFHATRNDCETWVSARYAPVREALAWLSVKAPARMTGTGASVFAAFESRAEAESAIAGLPPGWWGMVARGVARSPLLERLDGERADD